MFTTLLRAFNPLKSRDDPNQDIFLPQECPDYIPCICTVYHISQNLTLFLSLGAGVLFQLHFMEVSSCEKWVTNTHIVTIHLI